MLTARILPCLDIRNGRVVKGVQFQGLQDAGDPATLAAEYERQGADELVLLDVAATPAGRRTHLETIEAVRRVLSIPLTVGGGVRTVADAGSLLEAGADKVGVNTAAVEEPALLDQLAQRFGTQCVVLAIDAARNDAGRFEVVVRSGQERTGLQAKAWAREAQARGVGEILLTSWDRDGTRCGYELDLIAALREAVGLPIIASGGANSAEHMLAALRAGADAVLAASIFHSGERQVSELKTELREQGIAIRP